MGKGSTRRPEDTKKIETNWPFPPKPKFWAIVIALLTTCAPRLVPAQNVVTVTAEPLKFGLLGDALSAQMRVEWTAALKEGKERGYCVDAARVDTLRGGDVRIEFIAAQRADEKASGAAFVTYRCNPATTLATIHLHLPIVVIGRTASVDSTNGEAYCFPSRQDVETGLAVGSHVEAIVCGPQPQYVFYFPSDYRFTISVKAGERHSPLPSRRWKRTIVAGGLMSAGVVANAVWRIDRDPGGYVDRPRGMDKAAHALGSYVLEDGCEDLGGVPWACALLTLGAGVGFEFTQGHVSRWDVSADAVGAVAGFLRHRMF